MRIARQAFVAATVFYVVAFVILQTPGLFDRGVLEWDARALPLAAFRFHGTGLFPDDLVVDAARRYDTPLWTALYWLGTLATDPFEVSKLLPFLLLAVTLWQAFQLGRARGGAVLGAACVLAVVHCTFIWNRMMGATPRGFGFPLVIALLRYAYVGAEKRALATLLLQGLGYPSALLCSAPAYALVALRRGRAPLLRAVVVSAVAAACAAASLWVDPRLGPPPTYAEAATLRQMQLGGAQPYYPLPPYSHAIAVTATMPFRSEGEGWRGFSAFPAVALAIFCIAAVVALRAPRRDDAPPGDPTLFFALPISGVLVGAVAQVLAYRFYLPDRMLQFSWIPVAVLALPLVLERAIGRALPAAVLTALLLLGGGGDGLPIAENLTDFGPYRTPIVRFLGTLPKDVLICAHAERSSMIQVFSLRRTLFSSSLNSTFFVGYAREIDRRMEAYYRAYYAHDLDALLALRRAYGVDYLFVDVRDFGPDAARRARYYEPWGTLAAQLLAKTDARPFVLAEPLAEWVAYSSGPQKILDLRKLAQPGP